MRWWLILIALSAGGTAAYLGFFSKNSFSGYSREQLDMLEREFMAQGHAGGADAVWLQDRRQLLQQEHQRRLWLALALGAAALAGGAAILTRGGASSSRLRGSSDEDARLVAAVGDPAVLREGARQKAATLLGVAPDAPPAVIEAALQAQLQQRDPTLLAGLAPDLKQLVMKQREELLRARDLLLGKPSGPPSDGAPQA